MSRTKPQPAVVVCPFVVSIDRREQAPFAFQGIRGDAREANAPIIIRTVPETLKSGDYSIAGFENRISIERKSIEDLVNTLSQRREQFEAELQRLDDMVSFWPRRQAYAAVVVEGGWSRVVSPTPFSKISPKSVSRSIDAYSMDYPGVRWWLYPDRRFAEIKTFRLLCRFWRKYLNPSCEAEVAHAASSH